MESPGRIYLQADSRGILRSPQQQALANNWVRQFEQSRTREFVFPRQNVKTFSCIILCLALIALILQVNAYINLIFHYIYPNALEFFYRSICGLYGKCSLLA